MIVLWKQKKQVENRSHDFPDHIYCLSDDVINSGTQHKLQSELKQSETAAKVNPTPPNEVKSNDYSSFASCQPGSTDVTPGGVEYSDMQSNIASSASDQCRATEEHSSEVSTL